MRNPIKAFEEVYLKISDFCAENNLVVTMDKDTYPMTIAFYRQDAPLLEGEDNEIIIRFRFGEDMYIEMDNARKMSIPEDVFNKLRTLSKEAARMYMLAAFYQLTHYYGGVFEPMWTAANGDVIGLLPAKSVPYDAKPAPADPVHHCVIE